MIFFLLACQCMSTVAIVRRETNSWRWPLFMIGYMMVLAYVASLVTFQGGRLLGFDWQMGIGLISSFAARETLVSTLSIVYNVGDEGAKEQSGSLIEAVRNARRADGTRAWTPLVAVSMMVFFVLACQCMSTVAIVRRETNSWRWPLFMVSYMLVLAYIASFLTYQGGRLLGFS